MATNKAAAKKGEFEFSEIVLDPALAKEGFELVTGGIRWWGCEVGATVRGMLIACEVHPGLDDKEQIVFVFRLTAPAQSKNKNGEVTDVEADEMMYVGEKAGFVKQLLALVPGQGMLNRGNTFEVVLTCVEMVPSKIKGHADWHRFSIARRESDEPCEPGGTKGGFRAVKALESCPAR